jgi:hypothetical protein
VAGTVAAFQVRLREPVFRSKLPAVAREALAPIVVKVKAPVELITKVWIAVEAR